MVGASVRTVRRWGTALPQRPDRITQCLVTRDPRMGALLIRPLRCRVGNPRAQAV